MLIRSRYHRKPGPPAQAPLILVVALAVFFTAACATTVSDSPKHTKVWLSDTRFTTVLPFDAIKVPFDLSLNLQTSYQGKVFYMEALVRADSKETVVIALDSLGTQLFEMVYDRHGLRVDSSLPIGSMKAEYLLADLQFAFFPWDAVRSNLQNAGFSPRQSVEGTTEVRQIFEDQKLIVEVKSAPGKVTLTNDLRQYSYKITVKE